MGAAGGSPTGRQAVERDGAERNEVRASLASHLNKLDRLQWLPLEGAPVLIQSKGGPPMVRFKLRDSGAPARFDDDDDDESSPVLKQTDIVLLTNSEVMAALGDMYMLGFVKQPWFDYFKKGEDSKDEARWERWLQATVRAPEPGCALEQALSMEGGAGGLGKWHAVCLGNYATSFRVWSALSVLMHEPTRPLFTPLLSCETVSVTPVAPDSIPPATAAALKAVRAFYKDVRHLNRAQVRAAHEAAASYLRVTTTDAACSFDAASASGSFSSRGSAVSGACPNAEMVIVQGPPGTGKTLTIVAIVEGVHALGPTDGAVMVCGPTNAAVGEVASRFASLLKGSGNDPTQQLVSQPDVVNLLRASGRGARQALLLGDCVLVGSIERLDLQGSPGQKALFLNARVKRLFTALVSWHDNLTGMRRLLKSPIKAHQVAAVSGDGCSPSLGAFVKQQIAEYVARLHSGISTLLSDLPSAAWDDPYGSSSDDDQSGNSSCDDGADDADGCSSPPGPVEKGRAELQELLRTCETLSSAAALLTAEDVTRLVKQHWQPDGLAPAAATSAAAACADVPTVSGVIVPPVRCAPAPAPFASPAKAPPTPPIFPPRGGSGSSEGAGGAASVRGVEDEHDGRHWPEPRTPPVAAAAAAAASKAAAVADSPKSEDGTDGATAAAVGGDGGEASEAADLHPLIAAMLVLLDLLGAARNNGATELALELRCDKEFPRESRERLEK
ncbi:hypothetical protein TSOC_012888 [Tetrabaena socialis]|uniref:DNA2/NAM7 helicase helicase domain-containing protein n=1 Tax=Tetrabaena socialis TaxID=47790 RepID=A0A2J7ZLU5_9CHLO|nr:hypothetical protein TSOC_012888 [Tetrabaena socialis]|eukprot:PNH01237.1 hypothetical protein TSOC_012888 [Tetrabaena socialis]